MQLHEHPKNEPAVIFRAAFHCGRCGRYVYMGRYPYCNEDGTELYCLSCGWDAQHHRVPGQPTEYRPTLWRYCRRGGHVYWPGDALSTKCSESHAKPRQKPRVQHDPMPCAHCGEDFTPKRSDARYCSGKCRVAAHRAR